MKFPSRRDGAFRGSAVWQGRSWILAGVLAIFVSFGVAIWLDATAARLDQDELERRGTSLARHVDERTRTLVLVTDGATGLLGDSIDQQDLLRLAGNIDVSVVQVLGGMAAYPIEGNRLGPGAFLWSSPGVDREDLPVFDLQDESLQDAVASTVPFLSPPHGSLGETTYAMLRPVATNGDSFDAFAGFVFAADTVLSESQAAEGQGVLAAQLVDRRDTEQVVAVSGNAGNGLRAAVPIEGSGGTWEIRVQPGPNFPYTQSFWLPGAVVAAGLLIALLLFRMGMLTRARAQDLTDRLGLAEELNRSKDRFLAAVSHELRTPLTVVLGVADEIGPHWWEFSDEERAALLRMMAEQAEEAANIVEDLLVAARTDTGVLRLSLADTDLDRHVAYALQSVPEPERDRVSLEGTSVLLRCDPTRLRQILRNLLDNAVRYGGPHIVIRAWLDGEWVHITVEDDGVGVEQADAADLFEPYERFGPSVDDSPAGVGIGLYVSRELARLMGGDLAYSRHDGVSRFVLRLQAAVPQAVDAAVSEETAA